MVKLFDSKMLSGIGTYDFTEISRDAFVDVLRTHQIESFVTYPETPAFVERISGVKVAINFTKAELTHGDILLMACLQYPEELHVDEGGFTPTDDDYKFLLCKYSSLDH